MEYQMEKKNDRCPHFEESKETVYLSQFEQGVVFALTGKMEKKREMIVTRCRGTAENEVCSCGGDVTKCNFYNNKEK